MKTVIFGCGFTGTNLLKYLPNAYCTELPKLCQNDQIPFDFYDSATWENIPNFDQAIITFKMTDPLIAEQFATMLSKKKVILLSSARNLINSQPNEIIDENSLLSDTPRPISESHFKSFSTILYLGLIWGADRTPTKWISEGRIKNGEKFINLIHVDDICRIIQFLLERKSKPNQQYLASDGKPVKWAELAKPKGLNLSSHKCGLESRRFNTTKLKAILPDDFQFHTP